MKKLKIFFLILLFCLFVFGFYLYKLRSLSIEASNIFGLRCTNVNPLLIGYKKAFINFGKYFRPDSTDEEAKLAIQYFKSYLSQMRSYVKEENNWLKTQKKFMNRWDFKLFIPWYIKKGSVYQWQMYQGYRDDAQYLLDIADGKIKIENIDKIKREPTEARIKRNKYIDQYNKFLEQLAKIRDWRRYVMYYGIPKGCTEENTTIPDTEGALNQNEDEPPNILPDIFRIDPDLIS
ncbi:MAG: hypothetical protein N2593_01860 [Patescibacteria group bacterium]|nr:hypothetical protein [Patescibacteria group bacterium]